MTDETRESLEDLKKERETRELKKKAEEQWEQRIKSAHLSISTALQEMRRIAENSQCLERCIQEKERLNWQLATTEVELEEIRRKRSAPSPFLAPSIFLSILSIICSITILFFWKQAVEKNRLTIQKISSLQSYSESMETEVMRLKKQAVQADLWMNAYARQNNQFRKRIANLDDELRLCLESLKKDGKKLIRKKKEEKKKTACKTDDPIGCIPTNPKTGVASWSQHL